MCALSIPAFKKEPTQNMYKISMYIYREMYICTQHTPMSIQKKERHRIENLHDEVLEIIEIQTGSYFGEDDIIRFEDMYGRKDFH